MEGTLKMYFPFILYKLPVKKVLLFSSQNHDIIASGVILNAIILRDNVALIYQSNLIK